MPRVKKLETNKLIVPIKLDIDTKMESEKELVDIYLTINDPELFSSICKLIILQNRGTILKMIGLSSEDIESSLAIDEYSTDDNKMYFNINKEPISNLPGGEG